MATTTDRPHRRNIAGWLMLGLSLFVLTSAGLLLATKPTNSQDIACDEVISSFTDAVDACSSINEDFVCYASTVAQALPEEFRFYDTGDQRMLADLTQVQTVDLAGSAIMNLSVEGEASTMKVIIFGPTDLTTDTGFNSFQLSMDDNDQFLCENTPPSMIIQTANNVAGSITINGVRIDLASTALVTVDPDGINTIVNIEGNVSVTVDDDTIVLDEGFQVEASVEGGIVWPQTPSEFYASEAVEFLANHPKGLASVRNINDTLLSCVATLDFDGAGNEAVDARIYAQGQECLYTFCADAGEVVSLSAEPQDGQLNPWIDLYGPDNRIVNFNNDISLAARNSLICNQELPEDGCYTVVVRPHKNASSGRFRLLLQGETDCEAPLDLCDITSLVGLNLRAGPGIEYDILGTLGFTDRVIRLGRTPADDWIYVRTVAGTEGWIRNLPRYVQCAPIDVVTVTPPPTNTPTSTPTEMSTPTPTNTRDDDTPPPPPPPPAATSTLEPTKQSQYSFD